MPTDFITNIERTGTQSFKYDFQKNIFGADDLIPMWVADMDFAIPSDITNAISERMKHAIYGYTFRDRSFNNAIVNWMAKRHGWNIKQNSIIFSPGVVPSVCFSVLAFTQPGDKIIVQPPVYFPFFHAIESNGRRVVNNPLILKNGRYQMDFDDLRKKIDAETRMIIIANPHNPGGSVWTKEELTQLTNICIEKQILIIADEIWGDLIFDNHTFTPIASISQEVAQQTITLFAPSKTFNIAGLAASGAIISNPSLLNGFKNQIDRMHIGMGNIFGNIAMETAYEYGEPWLNELLPYLQANRDFVVDYFEKNIPEIKVIVPQSTYLIWLDCSSLGFNNEQLRRFMIEKAKLGLNDGPTFGIGGEGFQRMNIGCPRSTIEKALIQIKDAIKNL